MTLGPLNILDPKYYMNTWSTKYSWTTIYSWTTNILGGGAELKTKY